MSQIMDVFQVPYDEIDPGIVDLVRMLNENGFRTTGSCEGGARHSDHSFSLPTVQIAAHPDLDETRKSLCQFLIGRGAEGFSVKTVSMHQKSEMPEPYSYVEVEFWDHETLRYFVF